MSGALYCTTEDIVRRLVGQPLDMSGTFRGVLAAKIPEVCADIDRRLATNRSQGPGWSFLAAQAHDVQLVSVAPGLTGFPSAGSFTLSLGAITTAAIAYNATDAGVASALNTALGGGSVTVAPAPAGGPWQVTFTAAGPQAQLVGIGSFTPADAYIYTEHLVTGETTPVTRRYRGTGAALLWIDDATSVTAVVLTDRAGNVLQTLTSSDWLPYPLNGSPIIALERADATWWAGDMLALVTVVPGYATAVPFDVREAAAIETIRSYLADRAGNDDRLGMTPFGAVMMAKAFTSKMAQLVSDYSLGSGYLRRAG